MTESRTYAPEQNTAAHADTQRVRDELRIRLDERLKDDDLVRALRHLADTDPDLVNEALHETGAPE